LLSRLRAFASRQLPAVLGFGSFTSRKTDTKTVSLLFLVRRFVCLVSDQIDLLRVPLIFLFLQRKETAEMGVGQSNLNRSNSDDHQSGDCKPCFFFRSPLRSNDIMGSPMPETPVVVRRKRNQAINSFQEERRNNPVFSSQYLGLEKEVLKEPDGIGSRETKHRAQVYEGKVSSFLYIFGLHLTN
jgi:hypothetical protein